MLNSFLSKSNLANVGSFVQTLKQSKIGLGDSSTYNQQHPITTRSESGAISGSPFMEFSNEFHGPTGSQNAELISTRLDAFTQRQDAEPSTTQPKLKVFEKPRRQQARLKIFEKPIPEHIQSRFSDFRHLFSTALWAAVSARRKTDPGDISLKLKHMGVDETDAHLYIVVQCEKKVSKKVKKFFSQDHVVNYLGSDFRVHVIGKGLVRLSLAETVRVSRSDNISRTTLCGTVIEVGPIQAARLSTLGGLIIVTTNEEKIYGMTAGHSLAESCESGLSPIPEESESDGDDDDSDEEVELAEIPETLQGDVRSLRYGPDIQKDEIGKVVQDSFRIGNSKNSQDWGLIEVNKKLWSPNFLFIPPESSGHAEPVIRSEVKTEVDDKEQASLTPLFAPAYRSHVLKQEVAVITSRGLQRGFLTSNQSSLMIFPASTFSETFDLVPNQTSSLLRGDSGAWVVNEVTGEVYGHVVSVDALGEAYVIPIQSTLLDIKSRMGARDVRLPSTEEISALRDDQRYKASVARLASGHLAPTPLAVIPLGTSPASEAVSLKRKLSWSPENSETSDYESGNDQDQSLGGVVSKTSGSHRYIDASDRKQPRLMTLRSATIAGSSFSSAALSGALHAPSWTPQDDETLIRARASGLNWNAIATKYFKSKTPNACRKRHEKLIEKRNAEEWDGVKLEMLAGAYMEQREKMWRILGDSIGEKQWQLVEEKCMENGVKNLQQVHRSTIKKQSDKGDSGYGTSSLGDDISCVAENEQNPSNGGAYTTPTIQSKLKSGQQYSHSTDTTPTIQSILNSGQQYSHSTAF